jgi:hypothetical protein
MMRRKKMWSFLVGCQANRIQHRTMSAPISESTIPSPPQPAEGDQFPIRQRSDALPPKEVGGRGGLEPTRYGDWEKNGRCVDF